jgi:hypothetical protein
MIVMITGPEKVGKTTLAREVVRQSRRLGVHAVHAAFRRPDQLNPTAYLDMVKMGARSDTLVVMDRGWPDEMVYGDLLRREPAIKSEAWAEWCLGAPMRTAGMGIVLAPPRRRAQLEDNDLQIEYEDERRRFVSYGLKWGYSVIPAMDVDTEVLAEWVIEYSDVLRNRMAVRKGAELPEYVGSTTPRVVLIAETRNTKSREQLAWAAMTTRYFQELAEAIGNTAVSRTNSDMLGNQHVRASIDTADVVLAFGRVAEKKLRNAGVKNVRPMGHPSYVFRWGAARVRRDQFLLELVYHVTQTDLVGVTQPTDAVSMKGQENGSRV